MRPQPTPFLISLGWNDQLQASLEESEGQYPARVIGQSRGQYQVQIATEDILDAAVTTKFHDANQDTSGFPAVGDWVAIQLDERATIHRVLTRKNTIQRKKSGGQAGIQMIATNVDFIFIVSSMNEDFDLDRLGRYIALGRESGCETKLLLTKSDLSSAPADYVAQFKARFDGVEVFAISSEVPQSIDQLRGFFAPGKTSILLGSSGVGKSTLTNYLLGFDAQKTGGVSSEAKGRHTTTARYLRFTRWGGMVIDTPGMQEILAVESSGTSENDFADIKDLALRCKFTNCGHQNDPGCAISAAMKNGTLLRERWDQFRGVVATPAPRQKKNKYSTS